jgi:hypothetical protein
MWDELGGGMVFCLSLRCDGLELTWSQEVGPLRSMHFSKHTTHSGALYLKSLESQGVRRYRLGAEVSCSALSSIYPKGHPVVLCIWSAIRCVP